MTIEDRLRAAIEARTTSVEPGPDALHQIQERLMHQDRDARRNRILLALGTVAAAVVAVVAGIVLTRDDGDRIDTAGPPASETTVTTTTAAPSVRVDAERAVFPDPATSRRFDDPRALATAFARDFLEYRAPITGPFQAGDSRSGEVEVRAFAEGRPMTVLVRQLEDDTWFVLGASVESIRLDDPTAGSTIASPLELAGAAHAFEGTVSVRLYVDGEVDPVAETFVTGAGDVMADFSGSLSFELPAGARHGVLVLFEPSAEDGSTLAATVVRVHF